MGINSLRVLGLMALAGASLYGQPTNGAVYWSATRPDCSSLNENPVTITNAAGATIGYSCYVTGTFVWLAAGGGWGSSIRVAAPSSGGVGVDLTFYDINGNNQPLDTRLGGSAATTTSGNDVNFALAANQPAQLDLLGAPGGGPNYSSLMTGSVYGVFYCPDAATCGVVLPQLIYFESDPRYPWALSVPITWDYAIWTQWSAQGVDDGTLAHRVSFVIYNEDTVATTYTVRIYDSAGKLAGTGTTPSIPPGGTSGVLLSDVIKTPFPSGVFKVLVDGGSRYSAVSVLQFTGQSATSLQVGYDYAPGPSNSTTSALPQNVRRARVASTPKQVFNPLTQ